MYSVSPLSAVVIADRKYPLSAPVCCILYTVRQPNKLRDRECCFQYINHFYKYQQGKQSFHIIVKVYELDKKTIMDPVS